jgi:hypothetical protein
MDQSLAEIRFRKRHRDVTRLRRMFENTHRQSELIMYVEQIKDKASQNDHIGTRSPT